MTAITITLNDGFYKTNYAFLLTVTNTAPVFTPNDPINQSCKAYTTCTYSLPTIYDAESNVISIAINSMPSWTTFSVTTFTFSPNLASDVGTYTISVTITDTNLGITKTFTITVLPNLPPIYDSTPASTITMKMNDVQTLTLPAFHDPEGFAVTFTYLPIVAFATYSAGTFTFTPNAFTHVGVIDVTLSLNDGTQNSDYMLKITVTNSAPTLVGGAAALVDKTIALNSQITFQIPAFSDPEGNPVTFVLVSPLASFVTAWASGQIKLAPTQFAHMGVTTLQFKLQDGEPLSTAYSFKVIVTNTAPVFTPADPVDQICTAYMVCTYTLPNTYDAEGHTVVPNTDGRPSFVSYAAGVYTFSPPSNTEVGDHIITIILSDNNMPNTKTFKLTILQNLAPIFDATPDSSLFMKLNEIATITLPTFHDPEGKTVAFSYLPILPFVTCSAGIFTFTPIDFSHVGVKDITLRLNDGSQNNDYMLQIEVINTPPTFDNPNVVLDHPVVALNSKLSYQIPAYSDPEGNAVSVVLISPLGSFISITGDGLFELAPIYFINVGDNVVVFSLQDGEPQSTKYSFIVTVTNTAPEFTPNDPVDQSCLAFTTCTYTLPATYDAEGHTVTIIKTFSPAYVTLLADTLSFSPPTNLDVGLYPIALSVSDGAMSTTKSFTLTVLQNDPPIYDYAPPTSVLMKMNDIETITLPSSHDPEGMPVVFTYSPLLTFIGYDPATQVMTFNPQAFTDVQVHTITLKLSDGYILTEYVLTVTVTNTAPIFDILPLIAQSVSMNQKVTYELPTCSDLEGNPISLIIDPTKTSIVSLIQTSPVFILQLYPTSFADVQVHTVSLTLQDGQPKSTAYSFQLAVMNNPPVYEPADPVEQSVVLYKTATYTLPNRVDPEGSLVILTVSLLPPFIAHTNGVFTISPTLPSQVGTTIVTTTLSDSLSQSIVTFNIVILDNLPPIFDSYTVLDDQTVKMNDLLTFTFPSYHDPNGYPVKLIYSDVFGTVSVDNVFTFKTSSFPDVGVHTLTVTLDDGDVKSLYPFKLTITNKAPYFKTNPLDRKIPLNSVFQFDFADFTDDESNPIIITVLESGVIPAYLTFVQPTVTFSPTLFTQVGLHTLDVKLSDTQLDTVVQIKLTITNTPPVFKQEQPAPQKVALNEVVLYPLPPFIDAESNPIFISQSTVSFITISTTGLVRIAPVAFADVKTHSIVIVLSDGQPLKTEYQMICEVTNLPPLFKPDNPLNLRIPYNTLNTYKLPTFEDPEGHAITITYTPLRPSFVTLVGDTFTFKLTSYTYIGDNVLTVKLSDGQPAYTETPFTVTFTNDPPIFTNQAPESQTVSLNDRTSYTLPAFHDPEGDTPSIKLSLSTDVPSAITLQGTILYFTPTKFSEIGTHDITITLSDGEPKSSIYYISVTVTNTAPYFVSAVKSEVKVHLNEQTVYILPPMLDKESNVIYVEHDMIPKFIQYQQGSYIIKPIQIDQIGLFTVSGVIRDEVASTSFIFKVKVINDPPYFFSPLVDQLATVGKNLTYELPFVIERESLEVKMSISLIGNEPLPYFMAMEDGVLKVNATSNKRHTGTYFLQYMLYDIASVPRFYFLKVKVELDPTATTDEIDDISSEQTFYKSQDQTNINQYLKKTTTSETKIQINIAKVRLMKASNDGRLKMRITSNNQDIRGLMKEVISSDYTISLITQEMKEVKYKIELKEYNSGVIKMKLQYNDSKSISNTSDQDIIQVKFNNDVIYKQGNNIIYIPFGTISEITVPPQASDAEILLAQKLEQAIEYLSFALLPGGLIINILLSMCIQYLWGMMNDLSFLTLLSMLSISPPGISQVIQNAMLSFIYFDVLMTDQWLTPLFFSKESDEEDLPLNQNFDENGFQGTALIKNLGSTLVYLAILVLAYVIMLAWKVKQKNDTWLSKKLIWNGSIRFLLQQCSPIAFSSMINIEKLNFNGMGMALSSYLTLALIIALPCVIGVLTIVIKRARNQGLTQNKHFIERFGTLSEGLYLGKTPGLVQSYWNVLILSRYLVTSLILVTLRDYLYLQIMLLLAISVSVQALIIMGSPMQTPFENKISVFNEFLVSLYLYVSINLTDFQNPNTLRESCGLALTCIVILGILINFCKFVVNIVKMMVLRAKLKVAKYQLEKKMKEQLVKQLFRRNNLMGNKSAIDATFVDFVSKNKDIKSNNDKNPSELSIIKTTVINNDQNLFQEKQDNQNLVDSMPSETISNITATTTMILENFNSPPSDQIHRARALRYFRAPIIEREVVEIKKKDIQFREAALNLMERFQ